MTAIIDGGSTKADWILLDDAATEVKRFSTQGFNPNVIPPERIPELWLDYSEVTECRNALSSVYYYGSGCGTEKNKAAVEKVFRELFPHAKVYVKEDMYAAAYAAYGDEPCIVCILGTGSNSCYFDGFTLRTDLPSLGYLLGDEGSGSALGKKILREYFMKKLPADLENAFLEETNITLQSALEGMYKNPRANAYLAGFNDFVRKYKSHSFVQKLIKEEMRTFLDYHVLPYPEAHTVPIHFIGSVASEYESQLREAGEELHLHIGTFVKRPIESLVSYHKKYILKNG